MDTNENSREEPRKAPKQSAPRMSASDVGGRPRRPGEAAARSAPRKKAPEKAQSSQGSPAAKRRPPQSEAGSGARSGQEKRRPAQAGERPRQPRPRPTAEAEGQNVRRAPAEPRKRTAAASDRKPRQNTGDSGYQPYRRANQKRKAQRSINVKTFFSSQNPVLKWFEKVRYSKDSFAEDSDIARQRKERRAAEEEKRRRRQSRLNTPAVIYTQPASFNRDRLIVQLITVLAVVAAFMIGLSVFFKVKVITVSGTGVYSPYSIQEASGISEGDNLLTFSRARATSQILAKLPYVKSVRIGIKLPDTVNIEIKEDSVVYAIQDDTGIWWLMSAEGKVTEMANTVRASQYTQITGLTISDPVVGQTAVATERTAQTDSTDASAASEETTLPTATAANVVTGAQKMDALLEVLKALEDNDIVGSVASIDITYLDDIILWYGTQYQVNLGDGADTTHSINYRIACMYDAILQMAEYTTGILDVSFTIREDQVVFTPFTS